MGTTIIDLQMLFHQQEADNFRSVDAINGKMDSRVKENILKVDAGSGMVCYIINVFFGEDTILNLPAKNEDGIQLFYVVKGSCCYLNKERDNSLFFDHFQTNIHVSIDAKGTSCIHVAGGQKTQLLLTIINRQKFSKKYPSYGDVLNCLQEEGSNKFTQNSFLHKSAHNLSIAELIKEIFQQKETTDFMPTLNTEIICKKILAIQLEQLHTENTSDVKQNNLSVREMQRIADLVDGITQNLGQSYNVVALSRETGMSPNKLQLGFKTIYGHTVSDYIRNLRLERAEFLIRTTDMNISEVVYTIGLTSRSYFCKIFKRKFDCAPKQYKNMVCNTSIKKMEATDPLAV